MDDAKSRILTAATELFLEGGYDALSVRAIATRAELSTIGIYNHFQGKQGILDALYAEGYERVAQGMDVQDPDPRAALLHACRNYLDIAERYPAHYDLIYGKSDSTYTPSSQASAVAARAFSGLLALIARLVPAGTSDAARLDAALQIWSVIHGFVSLRRHVIAQVVSMDHWRDRALPVLALVADALAKGECLTDPRPTDPEIKPHAERRREPLSSRAT
ncbi:MAG: TetR/AcrR family transcriptional regulator [Polaromonas sp.]|uniref:TetR/AcrR family transcriptional regulator n=1 Tax=Polaromonas sp. TaxID=1869339 RepID=UPI00185A5843|nr:TetR family transcriptional regulator [Polaromonas sp.]MBA3595735.1 TetR/AcrR family transcriptional regulator [Polaromonas sp.]